MKPGSILVPPLIDAQTNCRERNLPKAAIHILLGTGHVAGTMTAEEAEGVESKSQGMNARGRCGPNPEQRAR